jgi:hypothetical protein
MTRCLQDLLEPSKHQLRPQFVYDIILFEKLNCSQPRPHLSTRNHNSIRITTANMLVSTSPSPSLSASVSLRRTHVNTNNPIELNGDYHHLRGRLSSSDAPTLLYCLCQLAGTFQASELYVRLQSNRLSYIMRQPVSETQRLFLVLTQLAAPICRPTCLRRDGDEITTCSSVTSSPTAFQFLVGTVVVMKHYDRPHLREGV